MREFSCGQVWVESIRELRENLLLDGSRMLIVGVEFLILSDEIIRINNTLVVNSPSLCPDKSSNTQEVYLEKYPKDFVRPYAPGRRYWPHTKR